MPPVAITTTRASSGKERTARRMAWPRRKQRRGVGNGCWMTLTARGTTGVDHGGAARNGNTE